MNIASENSVSCQTHPEGQNRIVIQSGDMQHSCKWSQQEHNIASALVSLETETAWEALLTSRTVSKGGKFFHNT